MEIKRLSLIVCISFFFAVTLYFLVENISYFKIKHVQIESKMEFLDQSKVEQVLKDNFSGNFFTVSLKNIRKKT